MGQTVTARADRALVCFYLRGELRKVHVRQPPGGRATDASDFPPTKVAYALRDVAVLRQEAAADGPAIGQLATVLLDGPLRWTRMRRVYALRGLVRRYGAARVAAVCAAALAVESHRRPPAQAHARAGHGGGTCRRAHARRAARALPPPARAVRAAGAAARRNVV